MPERLGPASAVLRFGKGLNSHPDPTFLEDGQLQAGTRVRVNRGALYKDAGAVQYGADTALATDLRLSTCMGYHATPEDPRLLLALSGTVYLDSDGAGTAWTSLGTFAGYVGGDSPCIENQLGATYLANGLTPLVRYAGGTALETKVELPSFDDTTYDYQVLPDDVLIDAFEAQANYTESGVVATDDSSIFIYGATSMKCISAGLAAGERCDRDLGASNTIDLSKSDYVSFWIRCDTAGQNIVFKFSEDNSTWQTKWINIPADKVNQWVQVIWDIRDIDPASRNAVRYLRFGIPANYGAAITWYLDHLAYCGPLAGEYMYGVSFLKSSTNEEGPVGMFRIGRTREPDDPTQAMPGRALVIPSTTVYLPVGADKIRLRRTMSGASGTLYWIADVTPAANAWTYIDTTSDDNLSESDALVLWPGTTPRAKQLLPHGDRMWHLGGKVVASRNDVYFAAVDPLNLNSGVLNPGNYPPLATWGVEVYVVVGDSGTFTLNLQRTTKGGSSWTTVATSTTNTTWSSATWYPVAWTVSSYGDVMFDPTRFDWRVTCSLRPTNLTLGTCATNVLMYRLICHAKNLVFMSNLGQPDKVPPAGQDDMETTEATGGVFVVGESDGQSLQVGVPHGSDVLLFKERRAYFAVGNTMDDIDVNLAHPSLGCPFWRTAKDCDGAAVWMAADQQIYIWEAGSDSAPSMLSKPLESFFFDLTAAQVAGANACYVDRRYYLFLPNAPAGSRCRFYDFDERAWCAGYDGSVVWAMPHGDDPAGATPYALQGGTTYFEVIKFNTGEGDPGDVTWLGRSKAYDFAERFGGPGVVKRLRAYRLWHKGSAADTLTVKWYVDRGTTATRTYTDTIPSGSGVKSVSRYVDNDIMGYNLAVEVGGAHDTETAVFYMELWLDEVR